MPRRGAKSRPLCTLLLPGPRANQTDAAGGVVASLPSHFAVEDMFNHAKASVLVAKNKKCNGQHVMATVVDKRVVSKVHRYDEVDWRQAPNLRDATLDEQHFKPAFQPSKMPQDATMAFEDARRFLHVLWGAQSFARGQRKVYGASQNQYKFNAIPAQGLRKRGASLTQALYKPCAGLRQALRISRFN